jgi:8-oxo-dGTP pyrophosphatase MutT (NUDIX family)
MSQIAKAFGRACLDDLLRDPLIRAVMQADRVDPEALRVLLNQVAGVRLRADPLEGDVGELGISLEPDADRHYRRGVGIVLYNRSGDVFVGQRADIDGDSWQMPQGGIEPEETPLAAALRELKEEIGSANVDILAESRGWLRYDVPSALVRGARHGKWRGQQQKWFAMLFLGEDAEIDITTEHPEFTAWQWVPSSRVGELIVAFKRQLYREVLSEFSTLDPDLAANAPQR